MVCWLCDVWVSSKGFLARIVEAFLKNFHRLDNTLREFQFIILEIFFVKILSIFSRKFSGIIIQNIVMKIMKKNNFLVLIVNVKHYSKFLQSSRTTPTKSSSGISIISNRRSTPQILQKYAEILCKYIKINVSRNIFRISLKNCIWNHSRVQKTSSGTNNCP